jgi:hypothetical protein
MTRSRTIALTALAAILIACTTDSVSRSCGIAQ